MTYPYLLKTVSRAKGELTYGKVVGMHFFTYYNDQAKRIIYYVLMQVQVGEAFLVKIDTKPSQTSHQTFVRQPSKRNLHKPAIKPSSGNHPSDTSVIYNQSEVEEQIKIA